MAESKSDALRLQMINAQLRTCDINDLDLLAAFAAVPREDFVAPAQRSLAYADGEVAAAGPAGRKMLSPRTLGLLLKSAAPVKGERALVVGDGAGYGAALLNALGLDVVMLETQASAARAANPGPVRIVEGPLNAPPPGAFDVIIVNGAFEETPQRLIAALAEGGRLVGLRAGSPVKQIVLFERAGGGVSERALYDASGDVLPGFARAAAFAL
ncbi:MAG: protein-L-isoaspartate O-methyltransferase [Pseudomonadota bacterium]|nr:protein-L-isoaspartate O-methyltransferase [Pseudomonadota bacterium]